MIESLSAMLGAFSGIDWLIICFYLVLSTSIGFYFKGRAGKGLREYFVSGRKLPWWLLGTSMVATTFAADTPLAVTGWIRTEGIWKNWFWWNYLVSHVLIVFVFARLWRRAEVITDNELVEMRYSGRPASFLRGFKAFYFATIFNFIVMGWVISAMAKVLGVFFGFETWAAIVLCLSIAMIYTTAGGLWGVVLTDLFQYATALVGTVILAVVVIGSPEVGGLEGFWNGVSTLGDKVSFMMTPGSGEPVENGFLESSFFIFLVYVSVIWWSSHNSDGGGYIVQRLSSAKDERHATLGMAWFVFNHYVVRLWPWVVVAVCSLLVFPDAGAAGGDDEAVYVIMIKKFLGPGLRGLLFVTFLSAFMSTITTQLNWGASYIVNDLYKRFIRPREDEAHYVLVSRISTFALCLVAGYVAFQIKDIGKAWIFLWAMSAGIGLVLILRWFWWRINAWSEITALAASLLTILALIIYTKASGVPLQLKHQIIVVPISIVSWITVTLMTKPEPMEKLRAFYAKTRPWGLWGPVVELSPGVEKPGRLRNVLALWVLGVALVTLAMLGVGKLVLGFGVEGGAMIAGSVACGACLWLLIRRNGL